jgi:ribonuclease D
MKVDNLPQASWVDTQSELQHLIAHLSTQTHIAVDTESNSLHAYHEQVCLIQFSTQKKDYLVDPLAFNSLDGLTPIFANPKIEKVFHAAEYDLICLRRDFGFTFSNIFDTMLVARILGYKAVGLGDLLTERFQIQVEKRNQRANWGSRPLSWELLRYAQIDTHFLIELRNQLYKELKLKDLWALAKEDFAIACKGNGLVEHKKCMNWERLDRQRILSPRERTILYELWKCREQLGEQTNRPVFKILSNERLMVLAQAAPKTGKALEHLGLTLRQIKRYGGEVLAAIRRGKVAPIIRYSSSKRPPQIFLNRLELLRTWRKKTAQQRGVESDIILPRRYLNSIAEKNPGNEHELAEVMEHSPWRLAHFGGEILDTIRKTR